MSTSKSYLTFEEMRQELRVGKDRLRHLVLAGEVRAYRVGRHKTAPWRFPIDEPRRYLEANRVRAIPA